MLLVCYGHGSAAATTLRVIEAMKRKVDDTFNELNPDMERRPSSISGLKKHTETQPTDGADDSLRPKSLRKGRREELFLRERVMQICDVVLFKRMNAIYKPSRQVFHCFLRTQELSGIRPVSVGEDKC